MFNWSHSVKLGNRNQIVKVENSNEISHILQTSKAKVKVIGSGMSFPPIGAAGSSNDILLDMSALSGCISLSGRYAQFYSSTLMGDIVDYLVQQKLQLICCPGVLLTQTIAGALATGTHGQGYVNAGLYDAVVELQVIHADGSIKMYKKGDYEFDAYRLHLGALGILTKVTLECEPLVVYKQYKEISDFETMVDQYEHWNQTSEHAKAWWFPETDKVQLWTTVKANSEDTTRYYENGSQIYELQELNRNNDEYAASLRKLVQHMEQDTKSNGDKIVTSVPNVPGGRFETVLRFEAQDARIGNMYQLWCKGIPGMIVVT
jgi:FAD/FMN-containing dehydrogenase